jgi:xanthine dehydrogenase accessory factor
MTDPGLRLLELARAGESAVWVRVERVRGSAPREPGASMIVTAQGDPAGTIGGGHLEHEAIALAHRLLASGRRVAVHGWSLGASLGQCCGGVVEVSLRRIDARELAWLAPLATLEREGGRAWLDTHADAPAHAPHTVLCVHPPAAADDGAPRVGAVPSGRIVSCIEATPWQVWVFGAGHVGEAVVRVLATMPLRATWVDARADRFPPSLPPNVVTLETDGPAHEVRAIPSGADVLVMTHSHALDFDLCAALLARDDLGRIGLIGSATKAASFRGRLARRGLAPERIARLECPVGMAPVGGPARTDLDRHPGAIAMSIGYALWCGRRVAVADRRALAQSAR